MTHSQIVWTIYALWLGAAVVYVKGERIDFIRKHKLIWGLCAILMVAPTFVLAVIALFLKSPTPPTSLPGLKMDLPQTHKPCSELSAQVHA
jgi:hypothetical protein